ncbi:hypothetical protein TNCV_1316401 [Trichonephila clavipes]|nr:hypothetical protein TNCV_1316401 [Trichonephila clavipes]
MERVGAENRKKTGGKEIAHRWVGLNPQAYWRNEPQVAPFSSELSYSQNWLVIGRLNVSIVREFLHLIDGLVTWPY